MALGAVQAPRSESRASVSAQIIANALADGLPVSEEMLRIYRTSRTGPRALMAELVGGISTWARS